jgi:hypothetical protein
MEIKSIVIWIALLLVITALISHFYSKSEIEPVQPFIPRCTEIKVNFYPINCNNNGNLNCSIGTLIGMVELNKTGYFIETENTTLEKLLRENLTVRIGNCNKYGGCWDGFAVLVPGTTEYLGGINNIAWKKGFFSKMVVRLPENCTTCIEEIYSGEKCS